MEWIDKTFAQPELRLAATLGALIALYALRKIITYYIGKYVRPVRKKFIKRQFWNYTFLFISIAVVLILWADIITGWLTLLSFVAAALVIASKEVVLNLLANGVIVWRELFQMGERVSIGEVTGDVMDTGPFFITIAEINKWVSGDEVTGRIVKVPNSHIFVKPVYNYSRGLNLIWNEISISLELTANIEKAQETALDIIKGYSHKFSDSELDTIKKRHRDFLFIKKEPAVYIKYSDKKVNLYLRYPCKFHKRRITEHEIFTKLLKAYKNDPEIDLAGKLKDEKDSGKKSKDGEIEFGSDFAI